MSVFIVKASFIKHPEEIRRVALRSGAVKSLAQFKSALTEAFLLDEDFTFKYLDAEGDWISVYAEHDFLEAMRQVDTVAPRLRIQLSLQQAPSPLHYEPSADKESKSVDKESKSAEESESEDSSKHDEEVKPQLPPFLQELGAQVFGAAKTAEFTKNVLPHLLASLQSAASPSPAAAPSEDRGDLLHAKLTEKLSGFSIKRLKEALARRNIDTTNVIEKRELVARLASALVSQKKSTSAPSSPSSSPAPAPTCSSAPDAASPFAAFFGGAPGAVPFNPFAQFSGPQAEHLKKMFCARRAGCPGARAAGCPRSRPASDEEDKQLQAAIAASLKDNSPKEASKEDEKAPEASAAAPAPIAEPSSSGPDPAKPSAAEPVLEKKETEEAPKKVEVGHPFVKKLKLLEAMGWTDKQNNIQALVAAEGDISKAINFLLR